MAATVLPTPLLDGRVPGDAPNIADLEAGLMLAVVVLVGAALSGVLEIAKGVRNRLTG